MPEYSISQLGKFEECALQYKFILVDGIKRYEEGVEALLGRRFHDAMEWLYKERAFRGSNRLGEARDGMAAFVMPSGFRGSYKHRRQPGLRRAEAGRAQAGAGEGRGIAQVGGYEVRYDIVRPVQASLFKVPPQIPGRKSGVNSIA